MKKIIVKPFFHRDQNWYGIYFPWDPGLVDLVKSLPNRKFSITNKCWYVPANDASLEAIRSIFTNKIIVDFSALKTKPSVTDKPTNDLLLPIPKKEIIKIELSPVHQQALRMLEQKLNLKGYSKNTARTYLQQFKEFLHFFNDIDPLDLEELEIRNSGADRFFREGFGKMYLMR